LLDLSLRIRNSFWFLNTSDIHLFSTVHVFVLVTGPHFAKATEIKLRVNIMNKVDST
jgi:hypothetical protein